MSECKFDIYDIMACDVYWDYGTPGLMKEQHKFLIAFYATEGRFTPDLVDEIQCFGPDGYQIEISTQTFTGANRNGFIYDRSMDNYWCMRNCATGFMKEGEYRVEVRAKNGEVKTRSRFQKNAPSQALVSAYLENYDKIYDSFSPSEANKMADNAPLEGVKVKWSPLKELCGLDAYYIYRIVEAPSAAQWDIQNLVWWDNVFVDRLKDPKAGLNKGQVVIGAKLKPNTGYTYFVEITDSNAMGETNICIFQPFRSFKTPQKEVFAGVPARP